ncbi:hypothetical protein RR48_10057 [Papilio machaon]|uniref:THAP-type domain-containing protein n=1 Tax=Papilio machaon TaxID=76193 RepID=A0A194QZJ7_PAPMA|nr:hypothetical protein RR48_10057 [Papilio machaon]
MSDQYRKCVKCGVTLAKDHTLTFHRFPKIGNGNPETVLRSRIWAEFCFPEENCTDVDFLKKLHTSHKMLCSKHFTEESFINISKTRLNKFSIPIGSEPILEKLRNIPGSSSQVSPTPGPSHEHIQKKQQVEMDQNAFVTSPSNLPHNNELHGMIEASMDEASVEHTAILKSIASSKKQNRRRSILKPLGVGKVKELSPREQKLYYTCRRSLQKIAVLKQKLKQKKKINPINKLVNDEHVRKLFDSNLSDSFVLLLQSQIQNCPRKPKGRRYNLKQQILALSLYKKSPAC